MNNLESNQESPTVSWQKIQGNKYSKSLHPAMLSHNGFRTTQKAGLIGKPKGDTEFITVVYDKSYVINWIERKLVKPLEINNLEVIQNLIAIAYVNVSKPKIEQLSINVTRE